MSSFKQRFATFLIFIFIILLVWGCASSMATSRPGVIIITDAETPLPGSNGSSNPDYALAQATINAGKRQLENLSRQATDNSLHIAQAAATQRFLIGQTQSALDAAETAQSAAAAAAQAASEAYATQTAQAQAILAAQAVQTDQAAAALTAFPITATYAAFSLNATVAAQAQVVAQEQAVQTEQAVFAATAQGLTAIPEQATQQALLMQEYDREQQAFVDRVVTPLIPIVATLVLALIILIIVLVNPRLIAPPRVRRLNPTSPVWTQLHPNPHMIIDGKAVDYDPRFHRKAPSKMMPSGLQAHRQADVNGVHIEIMDPAETPVAHWIAEVEIQQAVEEGQSL